MPRLFFLLLCLLFLAACDSGGPGDAAPLPFVVTAVTPSGAPVAGLVVTLEYPLIREVGEEGDRTPLSSNYPNPFSSATSFEFELAEESAVALEVLDLEGRPVAQGEGFPPGYLVQDTLAVGFHNVLWWPDSLQRGGVYRARLTTEQDTASVFVACTGPGVYPHDGDLRVVTALGETDEQGRSVTEDRATFPQLYDDVVFEHRGVNNEDLGLLTPSDSIVIVLSDGDREQTYSRVIRDSDNTFDLTWEP